MSKKGDNTEYNYDPESSRRMVDIAEKQQAMAEEAWGMYKDYFQDFEIAAAQANKEMLPLMTNVNRAMLEEMEPATREFFKEATEGVDVSRRQDEAEADVVAAFGKVPGAMRLEATKYGIDPSSQRFQTGIKRLGLDVATATAGARTGARERTETEKFNRLAVATGKQPLGGGYAPMPDQYGRVAGTYAQAAQTYAPLATRVLSSETNQRGGGLNFLGDVASMAGGMWLGNKMIG